MLRLGEMRKCEEESELHGETRIGLNVIDEFVVLNV